MLTRNRRDSTLTQRLYPLRHGPQRAINDGFFGLINPIEGVFQSNLLTFTHLLIKLTLDVTSEIRTLYKLATNLAC